MKKRNSQRGFTIIELMITLVILAIMISLAAPSFTKMIRDNRVQTSSTSLISAFNMAHSEAVRRGRTVKICATDDAAATPPACSTNWANGWFIFTDLNDDGDASDTVSINGENVVEVVVRVGDAMNGVEVDASGAANLVEFNSRGMVESGAGDYVFTPADCSSGDKQFTINLGAVGRSSSAEDVCP